jgi:choice-of-anchor B domain-containing protein
MIKFSHLLPGFIFLLIPNLLLPQNLKLVAHVDPAPGTTYSEVTGCGDLAIIGAFQSNSFVWIYDLANKHNPVLLSAIPIQSACLDVQVHGRHLFISFGNGMAWYDILDPRQPKLVKELRPSSPGINAHTSFVSGNTLYIADQISSGVRIFDITDKKNPKPLADLLDPGWTIHDMTIIRGRMYAAWIFGQPSGQLMRADVADPAKPRALAKVRYPQAGTHSAWPTEDEQYILSTDEVNGTRHNLKIWDARTPGQLTQVAEFTPPGAAVNSTIHNIYVRGRYAYMSYYCVGVHIVDIADPARPQEVAFYDLNDNAPCSGYDSNWGVDPFSNLIYASDMQHGLYVLEFAEHPAANLAGKVIDASTSAPVSGAMVYFLDEYPTSRTNAAGEFGIPWFKNDTVRVVTEAIGLRPDTSIFITMANAPTPVTIRLNGAPLLKIAGSQIDDDNAGGSTGNGNGTIDAVETYEWRLSLQNIGFAGLSAGSLRLRSNDIYVNIIDSVQTVGAIPINGTAPLNGAFRFSVAPVVPANHQAAFKLALTLNQQIPQELDFALPVQPPRIENFHGTSTANSVTLFWQPARDAQLNGYHLYRKNARQPDAEFAKITSAAIRDTTFNISGLTTGEILAFAITKVVGGFESLAGARITMAVREGTPKILVVNGVDFAIYTSEMTAMYVARFFNAGQIFDIWDVISEGEGFPNEYFIIGQTSALTFEELRRYQAVVWVGNNFNGDIEA